MITNWTVKNFKSIYGRKTLDFGGLTLFAGANSSGKSTILQSILLVTQTLQSQVVSRPIILNGHIVRLGTFDDILSNNAAEREVSIGCKLNQKEISRKSSIAPVRFFYNKERIEQLSSATFEFTFAADGVPENKEALQLQPILKKAKVQFLAKDKDDNATFEFRRRMQNSATTIRSLKLSEASVTKQIAPTLDYEVTTSDQLLASPYLKIVGHIKPAGVFVRHFMPAHLTGVYEAVQDESEKAYQAFSEPMRYRTNHYPGENDFKVAESNPEFKNGVLSIYRSIVDTYKQEGSYKLSTVVRRLVDLSKNFSLDKATALYSEFDSLRQDTLSRRFSERKQEFVEILRNNRADDYQLTAVPLPDAIAFSADLMKSFFATKVKYLGPLRDEPKPVYPIAGNSEPNDIGFKGEYTAAVLDTNKNTLINYYPTDSIPYNDREHSIKNVKLQDAVLDWLSYMGIGEKYATEDKGKLGHELRISTTGSSHLHDLTHVGVGVSQVLPILVLALLAESGSTLIFEQPELHLNPRVQTRLGDFFASQLLLGKQCIIETHSEYIVNRLRFLTSESDDGKISEELKMYFVEKSEQGSTYRLVEMTKSGIIKDWPDGFFDESEKNAASIIRSKLRNKRAAGI